MPEKSSNPVHERPLNRTAAKKQAKREAILHAAMEEFSEHGFGNTNLATIADRASMAKGTLYLYFESKEALFAAVVRHIVAEPVAFEAQTGADAFETFRLLLTGMVEQLQSSGRSRIATVALTEGNQFPHLMDIYIEAVLDPILARIAAMTDAMPSPRLDVIRRFPQLIMAPVLVGLIWNRFMTNRSAIDLAEILNAQFDLVAGQGCGD